MRTIGPIFSYFKSLVVIIAVLGFCVSCNPRPDEVLKTATSKKVSTNPFSPTGADWPQDHSDISPDSRVHFGRLPNGLRYAILPVADRKGSVSIQMNVAAGFNDEPDNAYGVAHVLEHMAFRGARGTKEASVIHDLQTMGARHGRDINGYTMADHTLYFINLNSNDSNTISAALTNMSRLALQPNLTEESLSLEKGVVISEMNLRDSLASRANQSSREFEYPDNKRETVSGIGTVESINGLQLSDVEDFYNAQYQPDNTLLIVTGDVKPRLIKKEISRAFLDWTEGDEEGPNTRERSEIDFSTFPEVATFREKESLSQLNAIENRPSTLQNDTYAYRKKKFSERIASSILKDRLKKRIEEDSTVTWITPFFRREPSYDIRGVRTGANDYIKSVTYFEEERLRALKYGFTGEEIERALETMRVELATKVERSDEIDSSLEAMRFRNSFISGQIYTNYNQNLELFDLFSSELTIESYGDAAKVIWEDFQPRYWSQSTPYIRIPIDKIRGVPKQVLEHDIKAHIADKKASFTPSASLEKGRILSRDTLSPGRVKSVLYENGSRLNYQRSSQEPGNIVISVTLDGDLNSFIELYSSVGLRATAFSRADIAGISKLDVNSALAGKKADFYVQLDEGKIVLSSSTRAKDLDVALSVIATFIADVDYKSEYQQDSFKRTKRRWIHAGKESPMTQAQLYLSWEYSGKSSAFNTLKPSSFSSLDSSELPETIKNLKAIIKEGRIEVGVVGDFNAKALEKAFSNSIGALPKRDAPTQSGIQSDDTIEPLEPGVSSFTHGGPDTQMALSYCWPLSSSSEPDVANIELVNAQVFYNRIVEHFRGELGITYSPRIISQTSSVFPNFRFYCFVVQIDSEKEISAHDDFFDIINDLKTRPVEKVELDRVREPEKSSMDKYGNTNRSLARILASAYSEPEKLTEHRKNRRFLNRLKLKSVNDEISRQFDLSNVHIFRTQRYEGHQAVEENTLRIRMHLGDTKAQTKLGRRLIHNRDESEQKLGSKALESAAKKGSAEANLELGKFHFYKKTDLKKAAAHLEEVSDTKEGAFLLGTLYFENFDVFPDVSDENIIELLTFSAVKGSSYGQYSLAERLKDGTMVERDEVGALKWALISNHTLRGKLSIDDDRGERRFVTGLTKQEIESGTAQAQAWIKENPNRER